MRKANGDDLAPPATDRGRLTERLRLEPVGRWTLEDAHRKAAGLAGAWRADGVGKWMAYDRVTGELVGRGGLSRMDADADLVEGRAGVHDRAALALYTVDRSEG
jgi:hypothetical protein